MNLNIVRITLGIAILIIINKLVHEVQELIENHRTIKYCYIYAKADIAVPITIFSSTIQTVEMTLQSRSSRIQEPTFKTSEPTANINGNENQDKGIDKTLVIEILSIIASILGTIIGIILYCLKKTN